MSAGLWGIDRFYYKITILYKCNKCEFLFKKSDREDKMSIKCPKCNSTDICQITEKELC